MSLKRPGGPAQFGARLTGQMSRKTRIQRAQDDALTHPAARLTLARLAATARMSARNFARACRRETGSTPAELIALTPLDTPRPLQQLAREPGFGDIDGMRRSLLRNPGVAPNQ